MHQPADPSAREISSVALNRSTLVPLSPAVGLRNADRKQIGLQQGRRDPVCEPPEALRRERFFVNQAADHSRTTQGLSSATVISPSITKARAPLKSGMSYSYTLRNPAFCCDTSTLPW